LHLFVGVYHFAGSSSSPDEDRLLKHLLNPDHQPHNLMTTPIAHKYETINVSVGIIILRFVDLVSLRDLSHSLVLLADDLQTFPITLNIFFRLVKHLLWKLNQTQPTKIYL